MKTPLLTQTDIRLRIWTELQRAANDRHHEWRTPVLATVGVDGLLQARTVVLRQAHSKLGQLQIYTDSQSPKVAEMTATPGIQPDGQLVVAGETSANQMPLNCY